MTTPFDNGEDGEIRPLAVTWLFKLPAFDAKLHALDEHLALRLDDRRFDVVKIDRGH